MPKTGLKGRGKWQRWRISIYVYINITLLPLPALLLSALIFNRGRHISLFFSRLLSCRCLALVAAVAGLATTEKNGQCLHQETEEEEELSFLNALFSAA